MSRPVKVRKVKYLPKYNYFIPYEKEKSKILDVDIKIEELEAMRLKDVEKLNQEECAKIMNISRQTFQNIIESAREKVVKALVEGEGIRIRGGYFTTSWCKFKCMYCDNEYEIKYEQDKHQCPQCGSTKVFCNKIRSFCNKDCIYK